MRTLMMAAAAASALFLSDPAPADAKTVTDVLGRTVDVPDDPQKVLVGFYFEDFFAIVGPNAYDRVAAISKDAWYGWRNLQWQAYTAATPRIEELTDVGEVDAGTFSLETAIASGADVAILASWQYDALGETVATMEAAGIPVVVADYNAQTVEKHVASTLLIGELMGAEDRAQALADEYAAAVADVEARVAAAQAAGAAAKTVYMELGNKGPGEHGNSWGEIMWGSAIATAGGNNIAAGQVAKWAPLNPEYVVASNPDVIFLAGSAWVSRDQAVVMGPTVDPALTHERMKPYLARPGWADLNAVKAGEVHGVYHGGARTLYDYAYLQYIAKTLYPDAFADVDPQATLERFFETYLPIEAKGAYMTRLPI
ncbi:MAG: ABC transporter substrate-binding protein [Pseudomonadota bacterium]